ncbi:hypothetical protein [Vibrio europaeus]|uniref:BCTnown n=1 Tax=Vibrio europaeus TaxID=300876 RepID=A0A178JBM8_9VIBR|nr:hypothetical protein [Vibrio europaeus]MDC5702968.1 hypothetical protein [Vibrio europaeus]MDC5708800.1 hypothetical protein [Vibrio europaeus]MDC5712860.1 hypothetical protein [Vibrio europaeus]MDC5725280.1 hypothetical protein [Vibrio europaeus]MDC5731856.1 hypothetical protein [Vibrio europaeus]
MDKEILGYITCRTCMTPKAIMQGSGKRKEYVYGRCECGPDNRCGKPAQLEMKGFKPLEDIQAEIEALNQPKAEPKPEPQPEPKPVVNQLQPDSEPKPMGTAACVGIGAVTGFVLGGVFKVLKAVA